MFRYPNHSPSRSRRSAFTLIELLTVIAIIGILAAIIIPTVGKVKRTAKKAQCVSRLRQWGSAIALQANDAKSRVILDFAKDSSGTGSYILDTYFNSGGNTVIEDTSGKTTDNKYATRAFWGCPTGINGGNTLSASQYAFAVPNGATKPAATILGVSVSKYYSVTEASSPSKLVLMIEAKNGSNRVDVPAAGNVKSALEASNGVRSMQLDDGYVRHGGTSLALFLDGHVSGLSVTETDYAQNKEALDRYFSIK
jgi:general secretion pathway protein G